MLLEVGASVRVNARKISGCGNLSLQATVVWFHKVKRFLFMKIKDYLNLFWSE